VKKSLPCLFSSDFRAVPTVLVCCAFSGRSRPPMTQVFSIMSSFLYMYMFHVLALYPVYHRSTLSPTSSLSYSKLRVAYNDALRQLLHEPRWCSASRLFHNVSSFSAIIRKLVYSLLCSLRDSNNLLVCAMLHSDICLQSSLRDGISCYMYFSSSFFLKCF